MSKQDILTYQRNNDSFLLYSFCFGKETLHRNLQLYKMIPFCKRSVIIIVLLLIGILSSTYTFKKTDSLFPLKHNHRSLRGGSYSSGGSSGGASGKVGFIFGVASCCLQIICGLCRLSREDADFEARVQEVKREVENDSRITQQSQVNEPFSGQYTASFHDPKTGVMHNVSIGMLFTPDIRGRGFKISGQGSDIDGMTVIEDGHANYDGTAWWREQTIKGNTGLKVLSRGEFNFQQSTFQGIWLANTTLTGPYNSFSAIHTSHHQQQMNYTPPASTASIVV